MSNTILGIMGAIPEEINGLISLLTNKREHRIGKRIYYTGELQNQPVVLVYARIGKVAAATTVTTLVLHFKITKLLFTGVAGAIHPDLKIGDIVLATNLLQHDMNAFPLMPKFEIPLLGKTFFETDPELFLKAKKELLTLLNSKNLHRVISKNDLDHFDIHAPKLHEGTIASGDQFFSTSQQKCELNLVLPDVLCVEMEGASVAQVCYELGIPFLVIRTISDEADDKSSIDFQSFIEKIASIYSVEIIQKIIS